MKSEIHSNGRCQENKFQEKVIRTKDQRVIPLDPRGGSESEREEGDETNRELPGRVEVRQSVSPGPEVEERRQPPR